MENGQRNLVGNSGMTKMKHISLFPKLILIGAKATDTLALTYSKALIN
jgi:hypothetical protein